MYYLYNLLCIFTVFWIYFNILIGLFLFYFKGRETDTHTSREKQRRYTDGENFGPVGHSPYVCNSQSFRRSEPVAYTSQSPNTSGRTQVVEPKPAVSSSAHYQPDGSSVVVGLKPGTLNWCVGFYSSNLITMQYALPHTHTYEYIFINICMYIYAYMYTYVMFYVKNFLKNV